MGLRSIVVDTGAERATLARTYGAEHFVDFRQTFDTCAEVVRLTEGGAHAVFVTAVQACPVGLGYFGTRIGAKLIIGIPPQGKYHPDVDPSHMTAFNQHVVGTLVSSLEDINETLEFARRGLLALQPTVVGLSKFNESVQKLKRGQVAGRIIGEG
ncbi:Alcohol dehydrogenase 1 [Cyphellophora attinorum]|uniref:Alcohol dehydrogenase 1 n=1 Tax=Cyphellophora attinorum TaxID=1664694 RepID=A0A0N0NJE7_9EURO|nr:Alcohol dehydrogenase 1 [Phialophora attinorum]KPI36539.1 Alcohol dehydrogenase 1 [Phialophora attinorum]